jgi:high-affinity Fe2+/Pb2+ permease
MGLPLKHCPAALRLPGIVALAAVAIVIAVTPAWCAEAKTGASEAQLIGQIILLIVAGRFSG